ncbi:MAG: hypothetical protein ACOYBC_07750 [Bilifractor sp.]|jgi:hypothetical protein
MHSHEHRVIVRSLVACIAALTLLVSGIYPVSADTLQKTAEATSEEQTVTDNSEETEESLSEGTETSPAADSEEQIAEDSSAQDTEDSSEEAAAAQSENSQQDSSVSGVSTEPEAQDAESDESETVSAAGDSSVAEYTAENTSDIYRMYNPNSGEHFYTSDYKERDNLLLAGWRYEGIGWTAPKAGVNNSKPVYRLYNPNAGDHHYTMEVSERDYLVSVGWKYEKIGWYSDSLQTVPVYRQYNPNAKSGAHNFTTSKTEDSHLGSIGWRREGISWYGVKDPDPTVTHPVTIYHQVDLSAIYDFNYYVNHNADVKKAYGQYNDGAVLEHFAVFGLKEGRDGKESYDKNVYQQLKEKLYPPAPEYPQAEAVLDSIGHNLQAAFNYSCMKWVKSSTDPSLGTHYYANIGYTKHQGNCYVMAGTFCELAKALGYNAVQVSGVVPLRRGGLGPHSWVEIDGYVYDPDFQVESGKNGYQIYYGKSGTWLYQKYQYMGE